MRKRKKLLFAVLTCLMIFACGAITVFAADGGKEYYYKVRENYNDKMMRAEYDSGHWYPQLWQLVLH